MGFNQEGVEGKRGKTKESLKKRKDKRILGLAQTMIIRLC
jgi:hypothetical protein